MARDGRRLGEAFVETSLEVGELAGSDAFPVAFLQRAEGRSVSKAREEEGT